MRLFLLLAAALCALLPARAQAPVRPGAAPCLDTILRLDGEEVRGRVLVLTPTALRYLPAAPAAPDTLTLPVAEVFLVRYANGTRELLHPAAGAPAPDGPPDLLPGLTPGQRLAYGRRDALGHYTDHGPYWATLGATLYAGPLFGVVAPAIISGKAVKAENLRPPTPALLADPDYRRGYQEQANRRKRQRSWGGYGTGVGVFVVLFAVLVGSLAN
ncbi:hypothetical protein ACFQ48_09370 [Hymenobacter caeli]|uniref:DUF3592 domain-containing protein n=1 Tax=Hymenobacter caeli TaxID=2735894 RepID=A0ABX2FM99_9BACT|nr:hypothetical protein [Hymenobacter caeli]NRT18278.1 hypothetical protein [Hymenobacter caeli]